MNSDLTFKAPALFAHLDEDRITFGDGFEDITISLTEVTEAGWYSFRLGEYEFDVRFTPEDHAMYSIADMVEVFPVVDETTLMDQPVDLDWSFE